MKFFGKHSVLVSQSNRLWYKRVVCVSPANFIFVQVSKTNLSKTNHRSSSKIYERIAHFTLILCFYSTVDVNRPEKYLFIIRTGGLNLVLR